MECTFYDSSCFCFSSRHYLARLLGLGVGLGVTGVRCGVAGSTLAAGVGLTGGTALVAAGRLGAATLGTAALTGGTARVAGRTAVCLVLNCLSASLRALSCSVCEGIICSFSF